MITEDTLAAEQWRTHMLAGDFAAAWRESDAIRQRGNPDPHRFWLGEDLRGKEVMLRSLHGYGDAVQFLRYAPRLRALAAKLVVQVPPTMLEIVRCFAGVEHVITWETEETQAWDVQVEITELPYLFRTDLSELPIATNYLRLPLEAIQRASAVMGPPRAPRVGLVWAAGEWNPGRSLPLPLLQPLLDCGGCEYWSLQGGDAARNIPPDLRDAAICGDGILPLASAISQLDLVITVDTLAAHLAGALGKPVWVLLAHDADWRWMTRRSDSPWYPSMTLFRQTSPGDWQSVVRSAQSALENGLAENRKGTASAVPKKAVDDLGFSP